jgi:hypothetical protein
MMIMAPFAPYRGGDGWTAMLLLPPRRWGIRFRAVLLDRSRTAGGGPSITEYPDANNGRRICDVHRLLDRRRRRRGGDRNIECPATNIRNRDRCSSRSNVFHRRLDRNLAGRRRPTTLAGRETKTASSPGTWATVDPSDLRLPVGSTIDPCDLRLPVGPTIDPYDPRRPGGSHPPVTIIHRRALHLAPGPRRWNDGRHIGIKVATLALASGMALETWTTVGAYVPRHSTGPIRSGPGGNHREQRGEVESVIRRWSLGIQGAHLGIQFDGMKPIAVGTGANGNGARNRGDVRHRAVAGSHVRLRAIRPASEGA